MTLEKLQGSGVKRKKMIPNFFLEAQENELLEQKTSNTLSAH
jgi:hypothetical protein